MNYLLSFIICLLFFSCGQEKNPQLNYEDREHPTFGIMDWFAERSNIESLAVDTKLLEIKEKDVDGFHPNNPGIKRKVKIKVYHKDGQPFTGWVKNTNWEGTVFLAEIKDGVEHGHASGWNKEGLCNWWGFREDGRPGGWITSYNGGASSKSEFGSAKYIVGTISKKDL